MGGLGILGPVEEQEIQLVTHAFRLLTSPVKTIKDLAWNSLLSEVTFKLKKVPSNEELCQYLNGVTEGTFRLLPSQGACLWNRIRTMTRQLHKKINLSFQIQDNQTVILHMKHPSHDNTHVHSNSRDHCYSALRASIMGFHSDTLISTCKDQGRSFHQISQDKINSKFISDGRFISHPTFRWIHAARLNQLQVNAAPGRGLKRPPQDQLCRRCNDNQRETLAHVLCHCRPQLAKAITTRHDVILDHFVTLLKSKFPKAEISVGKSCDVAGRNVKPDIVIVDRASKHAFILDVRCSFEGSVNCFKNSRDNKRTKYEPERLAFSQQGFICTCDALIVGALGSWDPLNDQVLRQCGLTSMQIGKIKRPIIQDTIDISRCIYWEHILGERYFHYGRYASYKMK
jgi:hypothetical protein